MQERYDSGSAGYGEEEAFWPRLTPHVALQFR
jgi:hypothetical protein